MPSKKRVTAVRLPDAVDHTLTQLARLSGRSKASWVAMLITEAEPAMRQLALVLQASERLPDAAKARVISRLNKVEKSLAGALEVGIAGLDFLVEDECQDHD